MGIAPPMAVLSISSMMMKRRRRGGGGMMMRGLKKERRIRTKMNAEKQTETEKEEEEEEKKISASGLSQLIKMGMGAISGDITEINLKDPKRTVVMELEANNFEDEDGNPISYVDNEGYVADKDENTPIMNYIVPVLLAGLALAFVFFTLKALA